MARIIIIIGSAAILTACGSSRSYTTSTDVREAAEEQTRLIEKARMEIIQYGDTLTGTVPIRPLSPVPQVIPVRSTGLELELILTDTSVTYKSIARPVARSSLRYSSEKTEERRSETATITQVAEERKRTGWRLPWWVYVIGAAAMMAAGWKVLNNIYNPFKKL